MSYSISLYKKVKMNDPINYIGEWVLIVLWVSCLARSLKQLARGNNGKDNWDQNGFMSDRWCVDNLFKVLQIDWKWSERNEETLGTNSIVP